MLSILPLLLFAAVIAATILRGRAIRMQTRTSAWAFLHASGIQRVAGLVFAMSGTALVAATIALAADVVTPSAPALFAGIAIIAFGAAIVIVAQRQMGNAWRVGVRDGDAPLFVTAGLFRFSRNPIFVGMILMALGAALAAGTIWSWTAVAAFTLACHVQTRIEEAHLSRAFGPAYADFQRRVPRWLML